MSPARIRRYFAMGAMIIMVLAPYFAAASPVCPDGQILTFGEEDLSHGRRCCNDITCPPGYEPKPCTADNLNPSRCVKCANETWQPTKTRLRELPQNSRCRTRTNCDVLGTKYSNFGNSTTDARCECIPGFFCHNHDTCLPRGRCPVGYGRDQRTHDCIPCSLGKTYSDVEDISQPCKDVTRCEPPLCTLKPATVQRDTVCGNCTKEPEVEEDVKPVGGDIAPPVITRATLIQADGSNDSVDDRITDGVIVLTTSPGLGILPPTSMPKDGGGWSEYSKSVGAVFSVLTFIGIIVLILRGKVIKQRGLKLLEWRRAMPAIRMLDQRYQSGGSVTADYNVFYSALERYAADYPRLGEVLFDRERMRKYDKDWQDQNYTGTPADKVHTIVEDWAEEQGGSVREMVPKLYQAIKKAEMYRAIMYIHEQIIIDSTDSNNSATPLLPTGTAAPKDSSPSTSQAAHVC